MTYTNSADMQHCLHNTNNATTALHKPATDAATQIIIIIQSARKYSKYKLGTSLTKRAVYLRCDMKTPAEGTTAAAQHSYTSAPTVGWTKASTNLLCLQRLCFVPGAATAFISSIRCVTDRL